MKVNNQLHKLLIQELKKYLKRISIYPKNKKEIANFREKSKIWFHIMHDCGEILMKPPPSRALSEKEWTDRMRKVERLKDEIIQRELKLLEKFEKELDPLILIELAKLNFRHFKEKYYIDMIVALRRISLCGISTDVMDDETGIEPFYGNETRGLGEIGRRVDNDTPLKNYARNILAKMLKVAMPKFKKGRPLLSGKHWLDTYRLYKHKLKLYQKIKKKITKSCYRNWQFYKSMLKKKYNVSDEEIDDLKDFKPSELAIEKTAKIMQHSVPWVKKQIGIARQFESMFKLIEFETEAGEWIKPFERFEIE